MYLTVSQIKDLYHASSESKSADEPLQARYYARPLSFWIAWFVIKVGGTPNSVTILALVADVLGCLGIVVGNTVQGAIVINIGHLLDYVDGTVAKATNAVTDYGRYLDRTCDEFVETVIPVSIGAYLYISNCSFLGAQPTMYLVIGFIYAILHLLSTVSILHAEKLLNYKPSQIMTTASGFRGIVYAVGINLKSSATLLLLPATLIPNGLPIFLLFFALLTTCELVVGEHMRAENR